MSFLNTLNKGLKGAINAINTDEFEVKGNKAKCTHCGHEHFDASEAQLNTAGLTFLNLDWANRSASVLICKKCAFIMWFASEAKKIV
jgi:uncharacterized protein